MPAGPSFLLFTVRTGSHYIRNILQRNKRRRIDTGHYPLELIYLKVVHYKIDDLFFLAGVAAASAVIFVKELFSDRVRLIEQCALEDEDMILGILPEIREKK